MTLINLTPHALHLLREDGTTLDLPSEGEVRVRSEKTIAGEISGLTIYKEVLLGIEGLPEPESGVAYIVSRLVAAKITGRDDIFVPGDLIRDDQGRVIGARGLAVL